MSIDGISVVIPIIEGKWLESILTDISKNTVLPDEIIVIDNSPDGCGKAICDKFPNIKGKYLPQIQNLGVNASWNLGISEAKYEVVCVLNDDLVLPPGFFAGIRDVFGSFAPVGFLVPRTEALQRRVRSTPGPPDLCLLPQRQGWAFTVRKQAVEPIPDQFFTWAGDDFLFEVVKQKGFWCVGDSNHRIFHHVGISQDVKKRDILGLPNFQNELHAWADLKARRFSG